MRRLGLFVFTAMTLLLSGNRGKGEEAGYSVTIITVDSFGRWLPYRLASFVDRDTGTELSHSFVGLEGRNIPNGTYLYRLERQGVPPNTYELTGEVKVFSQHLHKTILGNGMAATINGKAVSVSVTRPPDFAIDGFLYPPPGDTKRMWVRLQNAYQSYSIEVPVDDRGHFHVLEMLEGAYIAIVFRGEDIIGRVPVRFGQGNSPARIEIPLAESKPPIASSRPTHEH